MKTLTLSLVSTLGLTILLTGCGTTTQNMQTGVNPVTTQKYLVDNSLPTWTKNHQIGIERGIAAVGITSYSKYGDEIMVPEATLEAKANLAGIIEEKLWDFQKKAAKKARIDLDESYSKVFRSATKKVVKEVSLSGAITIDRYQSPVTGSLYIRVMLPFDDFKEEFEDSKESLKENYKKMGITTQAAEQMVEDVEDEADNEWNN